MVVVVEAVETLQAGILVQNVRQEEEEEEEEQQRPDVTR